MRGCTRPERLSNKRCGHTRQMAGPPPPPSARHCLAAVASEAHRTVIAAWLGAGPPDQPISAEAGIIRSALPHVAVKRCAARTRHAGQPVQRQFLRCAISNSS